jgi:hypothetical protein
MNLAIPKVVKEDAISAMGKALNDRVKRED